MDKLGLILISILPSIVIAIIIYMVDRKEREPFRQLIKAFLCGILSVIITLVISIIFKIYKIDIENVDILHVLFYSFIAVSLVEEFSKWITGYLFLRKNKEYNYMFDGIVYYAFVALGFATVENLLYCLDSGYETALIRAVSTVPAHAFFGVTCGYYYSLHKNEKFRGNKSKSNNYLFLSLFMPIILHGFYDFCLLSRNYPLIITCIVFIVSLYSFSIRNIKKMEKMDRLLSSNEEYCLECGEKIEDSKCKCHK